MARSTSPSASGGRPRPAWIRIGTRASFGEREYRPHLRTVEHEVLRARMQLDAARAGAQARSPSPIGSSAGSRRQNGVSRPSLSAAHAMTRSLGTRRRAGARGRAAGTRTHAARRPRSSWASSWSRVSERPSSSRPRWVWASITSALGRAQALGLRQERGERARCRESRPPTLTLIAGSRVRVSARDGGVIRRIDTCDPTATAYPELRWRYSTGQRRSAGRDARGREGARRRAAAGAVRAAEGGQGGLATTSSRCCGASASAGWRQRRPIATADARISPRARRPRRS